jgi:hypothetical protein
MPGYLAGALSPVGCDEQNPVVDSSGKAQMQPVKQGLTLLQLPLQAAKPLLSVLNWCAETVPAQRTAVTIAARNVDLSILLLMVAPVLKSQPWVNAGELHSTGFAGGLTGPGSLTHAPEVPLKIWQMQTPLQGFVALQVPVQAGTRLGFFCNCRAETVPAQRTAVTITASKVLLLVLLLRMLISFLLGAQINTAIGQIPSLDLYYLLTPVHCSKPNKQ